MTDTKLPEWPESTPEMRLHVGFVRATPMERYERARSDAAIARLRLVNEFLSHVIECSAGGEWPHQEALSLRAAIGELPDGQ